MGISVFVKKMYSNGHRLLIPNIKEDEIAQKPGILLVFSFYKDLQWDIGLIITANSFHYDMQNILFPFDSIAKSVSPLTHSKLIDILYEQKWGPHITNIFLVSGK